MVMVYFKYGLKHVFDYKTKEMIQVLITILVSGFILSARSWPTIEEGITNFILFSVTFGIMYLIFLSAQKFIAFGMGYEARYSIWKFGPVVGFLLSMYLILLLPASTLYFVVLLYLGSMSINKIPHMRLGELRKGVNIKDMMIVGLYGPIVTLIAIIILLPIYAAVGSEFLRMLIIFGSLILFFTALPFPSMNGINILIKSRMGWVFYFFFCLIFLLLIASSMASWNVWVYFLAVVIAGLISWFFKKFIVPKLH